MYKLRLESKAKGDGLAEKRIKTLMNTLYDKMAQSAKLKQDMIKTEFKNTFETSGA